MPQLLLASKHLPSDDAFSLAVITCDPQTDTPLHTHDFCELVLVTRGYARHVTEEETYPIQAGDVFVVLGDRVHGYEQTTQLGLINLLFRPDFLTQLSLDVRQMPGFHVLLTLEPDYRQRHRFASRLHLPPPELQRLREWVNYLTTELRDRRPGYRFASMAWFMVLIGYLCRSYEERRPPAAQQLFRIGRALGYLEQHCAEPLSVPALAEIAHMSVSSLYRAFRETVGMAPLEYQQQLRLSRACHLLRNSDLPIGEIGLRVGFSDPNYFSRQFRQWLGITPRGYRRGTPPTTPPR